MMYLRSDVGAEKYRYKCKIDARLERHINIR